MITLYGIPNCDTMKKARAWLAEHGVDYAFHDYKRAGLDAATLRGWVGRLGWQALVNTRGTTWRKVPAEVRDTIDEETAIALMLETPSLIRRPVLDNGDALHVGFRAEDYARLLG
jgi:Spx/MgsR family transcriptional regulator